MIKTNKKDKFIKGLKSGKYTIKNASKSLLLDKDVLVLCALYSKESIINKLPKDYLKDVELLKNISIANAVNLKDLEEIVTKEFFLGVCEKNDKAMIFIPKSFETLDFLRQVVSVNGLCIRNVPSEFLDDRDLAYLAVKNNAMAFRSLKINFRKDFGLAKLAVSSRPENFFGLDENLRENEEIVKATFLSNPIYTYCIYKDKISDKLKENTNVALSACSSNLDCLMDVPTKTFLSNAFKKGFNKIIIRKEHEIVNNKDERFESLEDFTSYVNKILDCKQELIEQGIANRADISFVNSENVTSLKASDENDKFEGIEDGKLISEEENGASDENILLKVFGSEET